METVIEIKNLEKTYHGQQVLNIENLNVNENDFIFIIGENGQGKTTLLNLISGVERADKGNINKTIEFDYFKQINNKEKIDYNDLDYSLLSHFQIKNQTQEGLSGGEKTKIKLTKVLSKYGYGLILDEPTTHLDKKGVKLLIEQLKYYYGTLIVVSHDRDFINALANKIWHLKDGQVREFIGNYDQYLQQLDHEKNQQNKEYENFENEKKRLENALLKKEEQVHKFVQNSKKRKFSQVRGDRLASTKQKDTVLKNIQKDAKTIQTRLSKLNQVDKNNKQKEIIFPINKDLEIHNEFPILSNDLSINFKNHQVLDNISFQFQLNKKIAIIGDNGSGKSSLLNAIVNHYPQIEISPKVVFSTYQQHDYIFEKDTVLIEYLKSVSELEEKYIISILVNLGFSLDQLNIPLNKLSGGQATKIALALTFLKPANVIILDEPTNFIDLNNIQGLEKIIKQYPKMIIYTSHDYQFIQNTADVIYQIQDKKINLYTSKLIE